MENFTSAIVNTINEKYVPGPEQSKTFSKSKKLIPCPSRNWSTTLVMVRVIDVIHVNKTATKNVYIRAIAYSFREHFRKQGIHPSDLPLTWMCEQFWNTAILKGTKWSKMPCANWTKNADRVEFADFCVLQPWNQNAGFRAWKTKTLTKSKIPKPPNTSFWISCLSLFTLPKLV